MNNNVLILLNLLKENETYINKIIDMDEKDFFENFEYLNYGYGLISRIRNIFLSLNTEILLNDYLNDINKKMYILDEYLLNDDIKINGYLVYDFFKNEYLKIENELLKILKI